jgi:hypothetical protein
MRSLNSAARREQLGTYFKPRSDAGLFFVIHSLRSWINSPRSSDLPVAQLGGEARGTRHVLKTP